MSRRSMPYHRRYHQDALQGYRKLTLEERGAYTTILDLIYDEGGPIDFNERWLAGELNCSVRKARAVIEALIEARKLYLPGAGKISNHRAETELENALKISRKCAENVAKREEKKRENVKIRKEINKRAEPSIIGRSTIPYTSTIYRIDNSEHDATREERSTDPPPVEGAAGEGGDEAGAGLPSGRAGRLGVSVPAVSRSAPPVVASSAAGDFGIEPLPDRFDPHSGFSSDRLLMALEGRGGGRARAFELAAIQRARRH